MNNEMCEEINPKDKSFKVEDCEGTIEGTADAFSILIKGICSPSEMSERIAARERAEQG